MSGLLFYTPSHHCQRAEVQDIHFQEEGGMRWEKIMVAGRPVHHIFQEKC